jgi:amidophosphoribosyltransferase
MKKHIKILKKKLKNFDPKLKEECGIFGVSNAKDASALTALGLHALQHRGQEDQELSMLKHPLHY